MKLVGVEHTNKEKKKNKAHKQSQKNSDLFLKLGKVAPVTKYRMK